MIVTMEPGIASRDKAVEAVVKKARGCGLNPRVETKTGRKYHITMVFLRDGPNTTSASVPDHVFRSLVGVHSVQRVTPPRVSVFHRGDGDHHKIDVGRGMIGTGMPCLLVAGPCTVDRYIDRVVSGLVALGIRRIRGGCWKPRTKPESFPGFGEQGLEWLLKAAHKHDVSSVFTEVIESSHIDVVRRTKEKVGFHGRIVLWVGARTSNPLLLRALGEQREFPVMVKNTIDAPGVDDLYDRADWVLSGNMHWNSCGALDRKRSLRSANHQVILCLRGTRQTDPRSPWRFIPNHHWAEIIQEQSWAPVAIDPSHSAGSSKELVMRNLRSALGCRPSLVMVEGGYPRKGFGGFRGFCDDAQMIPLEDMRDVVTLVTKHNWEMYNPGRAVH